MNPTDITIKAKALLQMSNLRQMGAKLDMTHTTLAARLRRQNWKLKEAITIEKLYDKWKQGLP